ncbi:hypothetical protein ACFX1Q_020367 [Malus domestica]
MTSTTLASHAECATSSMNPASNSLSISTSMIATRSGAKCLLFWITGLVVRSTCSLWQATLGSISGMSDGDHAKTSRFSLRKIVSSSFSSGLSSEPILAVFSGCWGSRMMSSASSSSFHPISSAWVPSSRSSCCNCYLVASLSFWTSVASTGVKVFFFDSFNICTVHRRDETWSDLISPTPPPGMRNRIF